MANNSTIRNRRDILCWGFFAPCPLPPAPFQCTLSKGQGANGKIIQPSEIDETFCAGAFLPPAFCPMLRFNALSARGKAQVASGKAQMAKKCSGLASLLLLDRFQLLPCLNFVYQQPDDFIEQCVAMRQNCRGQKPPAAIIPPPAFAR